MKALLKFLSDAEIEKLHQSSLEILSKTGIRMYSEKTSALLVKNGARREGDIVKLPARMVQECIGRVSKDPLVLGARDPGCDLLLDLASERAPFTSPSGYSPFLYDLETCEKKQSTSRDLRDFARVCDFLEVVDFFWPIVVPTEQPGELEELYSLAISLMHTRKHIQCSCTSEKTARWQIELVTLLSGSKKSLTEKPLFSTISAPITPLTFEKGTAEAMVILAEAGIPVATMSLPLGSSTAPVTLAGILALCNAEQLASLVLIKCANPDAPMIYAAEAMPAHRKTANMNYKAPEYPLLSTGCAQMARYYNLPSIVADIPLEELPTDMVSLERNALKVAISYMSRSSLSAWLGSVDLALGASMVQLMLDAEACAHARAYLRGFAVNDDTLALDIIDKVGPGGYFLGQHHTVKHFKNELWLKDLDHSFYIDSSTDDTFAERARRRARELIKEEPVYPLEAEKVKQIEQILVEARKDILKT